MQILRLLILAICCATRATRTFALNEPMLLSGPTLQKYIGKVDPSEAKNIPPLSSEWITPVSKQVVADLMLGRCSPN